MSADERMPQPGAPEPPTPPAGEAAPDAPASEVVPGTPAPTAAPRVPTPSPESPVAPSVVEAPSPDIALAQDASPLPGAHRGGFRRLPTAPVEVMVETAPAEPGTEPELPQWPKGDAPAPQRGLAGWALAFAIVGLVVSLFVGWGFPIGIAAGVAAILALRRPIESRAIAVWALVLATVSIVYSAGWLLYAASRAELIG